MLTGHRRPAASVKLIARLRARRRLPVFPAYIARRRGPRRARVPVAGERLVVSAVIVVLVGVGHGAVSPGRRRRGRVRAFVDMVRRKVPESGLAISGPAWLPLVVRLPAR